MISFLSRNIYQLPTKYAGCQSHKNNSDRLSAILEPIVWKEVADL